MTPGDLDARLARAARRLRPPGLAAARVDASGPAVVAVTGVRVRGGDVPVRDDDPWHIGSCTKAFTAALYARLVARGAAAWGTPLPDLLPDLAPGMDRGWGAVTIDALLRHRAGLPGDLAPAVLAAAHADPRPPAAQRAEAAARALADPPLRPGAFAYSNLGYVVAGAAIEAVTGRPWEDALRDDLLGPLGIRSAGVGAPPGGPWGHAPRWGGAGRGRPVPPDAPDADNPRVMDPAGGLHMTLADWGRFVAEFLDGGATVLDEDAVARLLTPPAAGPAVAMGWVHPPPRARGALRGVGIGHQGSNLRWVASAFLDDDRRRAALVVTNDGRARMRTGTARLAADVLSAA